MSILSLAMVDMTRSIAIAVFLAFMLCVCIHEFSHALVAYIGGDKSVRAKGYLSLDPTRFIHPINTLLIPGIILLLGGFPLMGGAVYINESLLKSRKWSRYVSAAGPASNLLLFLIFGMLLHPTLGLVDLTREQQPNWVYFCGAMATLNFIAGLFNLIPCPPLDGYRMIEHQFSKEMQWRFRQPQFSMMAFGVLFMLFLIAPQYVWIPFFFMLEIVTDATGIPLSILLNGYNFCLFGSV